MQLTLHVTERDFEALLALASQLNAAVGHDPTRHHTITGVAGAALTEGIQRIAAALQTVLPETSSAADVVHRAVERDLRQRHLARELLAERAAPQSEPRAA